MIISVKQIHNNMFIFLRFVVFIFAVEHVYHIL